MKNKIFLVGIGLLLAARLFAQSEIPSIVLQKADSLVAKRSFVWRIQEGIYSAEFMEDTLIKSFGWNGVGELLFAEQLVSVESLPVIAKSYVIQNYPKISIKRVFLRMENKQGPLLYRVEVGEVDLFFDVNGNFLKSQMKTGKTIQAV